FTDTNVQRVPRLSRLGRTRYVATCPEAVSSAVEHLVYTERVGGSKPSPPTSLCKRRSGVRQGLLPDCPASARIEQETAMQFGPHTLKKCRYGWMLYSGPTIGKCFEMYGEY